MAKHKVTKDFDYAEDGINTKTVKAGDEIEVNPDIATGLIAEGFIANGAAAETASKVAGKAIKDADLSEVVNDTDAVKDKIATAEAGISDGHIGQPEAAAIVDENRVIETLPATGDNVAEADKPEADKKK